MHSLLKLMFRASGLAQRSNFDIFQEAVFCTLASSTNLVVRIIPVEPGQYVCRFFNFFLLETDRF